MKTPQESSNSTAGTRMASKLTPAGAVLLAALQTSCASQVDHVYTQETRPQTRPNTSEGFGNVELLSWMEEHCVRQSTVLEGQSYSGRYKCDDGVDRIAEKVCNTPWVVVEGQDPKCGTGGMHNIYRAKK